MKIEVPIIYKGLANFIVEVSDTLNEPEAKQEAEEVARARFHNGEEADELGNEFEEIDRIGDVKIIQ